jgi:hypothetical protein
VARPGIFVAVCFTLGLCAAAASALPGPQGSTYDFELLLGADTDSDGSAELFRISNGPGDFNVTFNGVAEPLPAYCCGLGTVPTVTETFTDNGNGTSTLTILATSSGGADLFPGTLVSSPGSVPLRDAVIAIGHFTGSDPLDWAPSPRVVSANFNFLAGGVSTTGGPVNLDPALFFDAPGSWDGNFAVVQGQQAGRGVDRVELKIVVNNPTAGGPCVPDATHLCLSGQRFRVSVDWETPQGARGSGQAISITSDTGYFWFFSSGNVEMVVKVLNACSFSSRFWVFAGGLTNVRAVLRVEDAATGEVKTYTNPQNTAFTPIQDTGAFATCGVASAVAPAAAEPPEVSFSQAQSPADLEGAACVDDDTSVCLNGRRFRVSARWVAPNGNSGVGHVVRLTADTAYLWFFNPANVEMVVKVLDACGLSNHVWVFAGGLTDVAVDLSVVDTASTGVQRRYRNPLSTPFQPLQDTGGFICQGGGEEFVNSFTPPPPLYVDPPVPSGGAPATVQVNVPGASSIALTTSGDGCGAIGAQNVSGPTLTQTRDVGVFGECFLEAQVTQAGGTTTLRTSFTVEPTVLNLPPLRVVGGIFLPGDPPAATAGAPTITALESTDLIVNGGTAELRMRLSSPAALADVDSVFVNVPGPLGYDGHWVAPARVEGNTVVAEVRLDSEFVQSAALVRSAWRRSETSGAEAIVTGEDAAAIQVAVGTRSGAVTAPASKTIQTQQVDSNLVQVSLTWSTPTDVDLHVKEPSPGIEIYYSAKTSPASGAQLNVDSICRGGTENITWPGSALPGEHIVRVVYYNACSYTGSTPYTLTTKVCGKTETFSGSFSGSGSPTTGTEITRFTPDCKFRVRGKANYEDLAPTTGGLSAASTPKPIRFARVTVRDETGLEMFGEGQTEQDGKYDVSFDTKPGTNKYLVEVVADQGNAIVNQSVTDKDLNVYKVRSAVLDATVDPDLEDFEIVAKKDESGPAFNIFDMGIAAASLYRTLYGTAPQPFRWEWTRGAKACGTLRTCAWVSDRRLLIGDEGTNTDPYDDMLLLHEFGHIWVREKSSTDGPSHAHSVTTRIDPGQAWDEGAASYFAGVALRSKLYIDTAGAGADVQFDLETPDASIPLGTEGNKRDGKVSEALVAAVLWDLSDTPQDGSDMFKNTKGTLLACGRVADADDEDDLINDSDTAWGPDLLDLLEEMAELDAASATAAGKIAKCNFQYPYSAVTCP